MMQETASNSAADDSPEELARWFVISVLRHLRGQRWPTPDASSLDRQQQEQLASEFIADPAARKSLLSVLRDTRLRGRLVDFAQSRDPGRGVMADSTVAFRQASQLLRQQGLVEAEKPGPPAEAVGPEPVAEQMQPANQSLAPAGRAADSISQRRAARRRAGIEAVSAQQPRSSTQRGTGSKMSDEEYAQLDAALSRAPESPRLPESRPAFKEDRVSLLAGMLAGVLVFLLVWWIWL